MTVAYFSSEVATDISTAYAGGLGVLAGDTIRTVADQKTTNKDDFVAFSALSPEGYGDQTGGPDPWIPKERGIFKPEKAGLIPLEEQVEIEFKGRRLKIGVFREDVKSDISQRTVPIYRLTTDVKGNTEDDRRITDRLYDKRYECEQYVVLGIGGFLMQQKLGINADTIHLNEGHSILLTLAQLHQAGGDLNKVRSQNIFFNHSVAPNTMPKIWWDWLKDALVNMYGPIDKLIPQHILEYALIGGNLETNRLGAKLSKGPEGVSEKGGMYGVSDQHESVLSGMFPGIPIGHVTNGVHAPTWVTPQMAALYDKHIGKGWRTNPDDLKKAAGISPSDFWNAHMAAKMEGMLEFFEQTGVLLNPLALTIGFARRATRYKDWELLLCKENCHYLEDLGKPIQYLVAGKPFPTDDEAKKMINRIKAVGQSLNHTVKVVFIENYNERVAKLLLKMVDGWANHPWANWEACGTSGMKIAENGLINVSKAEGWYHEAVRDRIVVPGETGFVIAEKDPHISLFHGLNAMNQAYYNGNMAKMMPQVVSRLGPAYHSGRTLADLRKIWSAPVLQPVA